ncbi:MAG: hypothetical protein SFZ23_05055 [Planctomycetota bacterium]|nr:hypothetical protein [Planctomycetota bacterium]
MSATHAAIVSGAGGEARPVPLFPVYALSFLASVGTGLVNNGIYLLADKAYGLSDAGMFGLGAVLGVTYVGAALGAGPVIRKVMRAHPAVSTRLVLLGVMIFMGLLCFLPFVARAMSGQAGQGLPAVWPLWVLVGLYSPLSGMLWPIVESYLSGGRRGASLRRAVSGFNVVWSSALVFAFFALAPFLEHRSIEAIGVLGVLHVASVLLLIPLTREPARHEEDHEPCPASYPLLLTAFRLLLATGYLVLCSITPYFPTTLAELQIPPNLEAIVAAAWLVARCGSFIVLERWHGWHGKWSTPAVGGGLILLGFGLAIFAASVAREMESLWLGRAQFVLGQALLGVGLAIIYSGALYYAMAVGNAEVDAGGKHEALIGGGYTIGPLCGLVAITLAPGAFAPIMLAMVSGIALAVTGSAAWRISRHWKAARQTHSLPKAPT